MSSTVEVYKCPNCGGVLSYDIEWHQYGCASCGAFFDIEQFRPKKARSLHGFTCPECGAECVVAEEIASASCPYCGNNEIMPSRFEGVFSPDSIIPFKIDMEEARRRCKEHAREKQYLPDDYFKRAKEVSAEGVYVPFWLFSGTVAFDATYSFAVDGNDYHEDWLWYRAGVFEYVRIPADASVRMPNKMMDSMAPYRFEDLQPFTTDIMPGFVAERYTESSEKSWNRTEDFLERGAQALTIYPRTSSNPKERGYAKFASSGGDLKCIHCSAKIEGPDNGGRVEQALFPVWLFVVEYEGKRQLVGVNGQTGAVATNYPFDKKKFGKINRSHSRKMLIRVVLAFAFVAAALLVWCNLGNFLAAVILGLLGFLCLGSAIRISATSGVDVSDYEDASATMDNVHEHNSIMRFINMKTFDFTSDFCLRDSGNTDRRLTESDRPEEPLFGYPGLAVGKALDGISDGFSSAFSRLTGKSSDD